MMLIRPIHRDELTAFAAVATAPDHVTPVREYLDQMLTQGAMQAAWCFVAEEAGRLVGRIAYWTLPRLGTPLAAVLLDVAWHGDYLAVGRPLLLETIAAVRALGAGEVSHVLDSPPQWPQWQHFPDQRRALLTDVGFAIERETVRFEWRATDMQPVLSRRLTFRSLLDVGENALLEAVERVSAASLDRRIEQGRSTHGTRHAAHDLLTLLQSMEYDPAWWQLAYTADHDLVGLVMPARNPTSGTIGYLGVVPEHRGHGYVNDLLGQATAILHAAGVESIRADVDVANLPMANAFRRAGYTAFATRQEYVLQAMHD